MEHAPRRRAHYTRTVHSPELWEAVKADVVAGMSYRQAAEKWGLKWRTIAARAKSGGWARQQLVLVDDAARVAAARQIPPPEPPLRKLLAPPKRWAPPTPPPATALTAPTRWYGPLPSSCWAKRSVLGFGLVRGMGAGAPSARHGWG